MFPTQIYWILNRFTQMIKVPTANFRFEYPRILFLRHDFHTNQLLQQVLF